MESGRGQWDHRLQKSQELGSGHLERVIRPPGTPRDFPRENIAVIRAASALLSFLICLPSFMPLPSAGSPRGPGQLFPVWHLRSVPQAACHCLAWKSRRVPICHVFF